VPKSSPSDCPSSSLCSMAVLPNDIPNSLTDYDTTSGVRSEEIPRRTRGAEWDIIGAWFGTSTGDEVDAVEIATFIRLRLEFSFS
jgi:hypothetical protein